MDDRHIASSAQALRHVFLRDLVLQANIGVHAHEHSASQRVRINIDLGVEDETAGDGIGKDELSRVVAIPGAFLACVQLDHGPA